MTLRIRDILQRSYYKPQASSPTQAAGIADLFVKTDEQLYYRDPSGVEIALSQNATTSAPIFNATDKFTINGNDINDSATLDNVAYLDYKNVFLSNQDMNGFYFENYNIPNDTFTTASDHNGSIANIWKLNESDEIDFGSPVNIGSLRTFPNHNYPFMDISVNSEASYGDSVGSGIMLAGTNMFKVQAEADGAGGIVDGSNYVYLKAAYIADNHTDQETVTGDTTFTDLVPKGYLLKYLIAEETAGNAATLDLGTTAGASDVFVNQVFAASSITTVAINETFSFSSAQTLYLNDDDGGSSWNSGSLNVYFVLEKITQ